MVGEDPRLFAVNQAPSAALRSPSGSPASTVERTGFDLTFPFRALRRLRGLVGGASATAAVTATGSSATTDPATTAGAAADGDGDADADGRGESRAAGGRLRRWWATTDRSFFVWGVASYLIVHRGDDDADSKSPGTTPQVPWCSRLDATDWWIAGSSST